MADGAHEKLLENLYSLSFKTGDFVLTSGARSNYYVDVRMSSTDPAGAALIGDEIIRLIKSLPEKPAAIGGMVLGAVPVVMAVTARSAQAGLPLPSFLVRKEAKGHGAGKRIEGHIRDGEPVIVVDDVITTAKSTLEAISAVRAEYPRCRIIGVVAVIDRQEGGREKIEAMDIPVYALASRDELFAWDRKVKQTAP